MPIANSCARLVTKSRTGHGRYMPTRKSDDTEALLEELRGQQMSVTTCCIHERKPASRRKQYNIKISVKNAYMTIRCSDAILRLRERIHQSPEARLSSVEMDLLGEIFHQILFKTAEHSGDLWYKMQNMIPINGDVHLQLDRVLHSGCSALQRVYSEYAESEEKVGPYIAPRSTPTWLTTRHSNKASFGATSWYIVHATSARPGQRKSLTFDMKIGIDFEVMNQCWKDVLPGRELKIKCLTPSLLPDWTARLRSASCMQWSRQHGSNL